MNVFWQLYLANWREFFSNRKAMFLTIAFPVIFIVLFGLVYGNEDKVDGRIAIIDDDGGAVGRGIASALTSIARVGTGAGGKVDRAAADKNPFSDLRFIPMSAAPARDDLKRGRLDALITIPAGLTLKAASAKEQSLRAAAAQLQSQNDGADTRPIADPAHVLLTIDPSRQTLAPALQAILDRVLTGVMASVSGQLPWLDVKTESIQAREVRTIDYLLPGILAMSIMQLGLFATAQPLVALRAQGVLKRLGATPLRRPALLSAYIAMRLTIALLQTAIIVVIGRFAFQVAMVGSWWEFSGWISLGTLAFLSIGFFMAAVSKNEESCIAIANIVNLPMILLSGVFFPVNGLPVFLKWFVKLVPLTYLADALRQTMVDAAPMHDSRTNAVALGAWALVMTVLAVRFFSWE